MANLSANWQRVARRIRVPLGFLFAAFYIWLAQPTLLSIGVGALIAIPGLMLRASAAGHVRKNQALSTSGPYAYTRNPLYLGSIIIAAGFATASRSWIIVALLFAMLLLIYLPVIASEEKFLRGQFPEFDEYARTVPRLLPSIRRRGESGAFSPALYRKHREYNALVGASLMMLALLAKWAWVGHAFQKR